MPHLTILDFSSESYFRLVKILITSIELAKQGECLSKNDYNKAVSSAS